MIKNVPIYSDRILFGRKCKPDPKKYIICTDSVPLTNSSCYLHRPVNFDSRSGVIIAKKYCTNTLGIFVDCLQYF